MSLSLFQEQDITKVFSAILLILVEFGSDQVNADIWKTKWPFWVHLTLPCGITYTLICFL